MALLLMLVIDSLFMIASLFFAKDLIFILIKDKELATLAYQFAYVFILAFPFIALFLPWIII